MEQFLSGYKFEDGFPQLLSYKLSLDGGEILMANAGSSIDQWYGMGLTKPHRVRFAHEMLRQIIPVLKRLHDMGLSHGDIKPENICARYDKEEGLKFTLIDFGVSLRLYQSDQQQNNELFRGNLNFASPEHLMNCRASRVDDLYSLFLVAYRFIFHSLPWEEYI